MLVGYSDSEGSDDDQPKQVPQKSATKVPSSSSSSFAIDKSTGKIKVNLQNKPDPTSNGTHEDEPAAKRPRLGAAGDSGAFSGFNAMLPAPKRDNLSTAQTGANKTSSRKVFSLRTGAEPAFSRESDAELRELFAEQNTVDVSNGPKTEGTIPFNIPKPSFAKPAPPAPAGKPFMFKPLSVARNTKKKKPTNVMQSSTTATTTATATVQPQVASTTIKESATIPEQPKKKINLFSAGSDTTPSIPIPTEEEDEDEIVEDLGPIEAEDLFDQFQPTSHNHNTASSVSDSQSLNSIANDLNLSAAERRQLFGRNSRDSSAVNVVNFNTDAEYAANQQLISAGEQVQHNPVRAIASGKQSLRQLVSSAASQKDALEESFASGKRNKKEAGNKYGW